ncbi:hypothetical protein OsJ_18048 [Oryza sativa Japonica Group]|uniref:Uncharacterized protein n=1 Tax=Oryza sativa subsp. japonica TaxID=39947 RepID=B9FNV7_ORYSJ|nr:hypothetical protein OsJ_18048 [Oryza sativa Japonica Group]
MGGGGALLSTRSSRGGRGGDCGGGRRPPLRQILPGGESATAGGAVTARKAASPPSGGCGPTAEAAKVALEEVIHVVFPLKEVFMLCSCARLILINIYVRVYGPYFGGGGRGDIARLRGMTVRDDGSTVDSEHEQEVRRRPNGGQ